MMFKALPLVHFWSLLLLKGQMMTSVRKMLKTLVWSAQNWSISVKIFLKITTKSALFYRLIFRDLCPQNSREIAAKLAHFSANLRLKLPWNLTFFRNLSEAPPNMAWSIRFENITDRSRYEFGGKLALFMRFGTFFMKKAKQDKVECLF